LKQINGSGFIFDFLGLSVECVVLVRPAADWSHSPRFRERGGG